MGMQNYCSAEFKMEFFKKKYSKWQSTANGLWCFTLVLLHCLCLYYSFRHKYAGDFNSRDAFVPLVAHAAVSELLVAHAAVSESAFGGLAHAVVSFFLNGIGGRISTYYSLKLVRFVTSSTLEFQGWENTWEYMREEHEGRQFTRCYSQTSRARPALPVSFSCNGSSKHQDPWELCE